MIDDATLMGMLKMLMHKNKRYRRKYSKLRYLIKFQLYNSGRFLEDKENGTENEVCPNFIHAMEIWSSSNPQGERDNVKCETKERRRE